MKSTLPALIATAFALALSIEAAARDYGVVIGPDGRSIDAEATAALRARAASAGGKRPASV